jgi:4-hydroxybutyrate CoA-transferase
MKRLADVGRVLSRMGRGTTIVLHSACAEPRLLARALRDHAAAMRGARLVTLMPMGEAPYADEASSRCLDIATFFPGRALRPAVQSGRARQLRYPLSAIPGLFDAGVIKADVLMLQVSPPDANGRVSLGVSVDYMHEALRQRPLVIAEINPRMPETCGDARIPASSIDWFVDAVDPPLEAPPGTANEIDARIAENVASLVDDGAVLQAGIGSLPDLVLTKLGHLKRLGVHSGILTDAIRPLIEKGAIDNSTKKRFRGVSVTTMAAGTLDFYRFLHGNTAIEFHRCSLTHNRDVISEIDGFCAINSVLQVDLLGNANAEQVDGKPIALPGGLPDFAAGASRARGGRSIVALRSTSHNGKQSAVVPRFAEGQPTTVTAGDIGFVVTEFGVADIRSPNPQDRARALIAIAHPAHREALQRSRAERSGPLGPDRSELTI